MHILPFPESDVPPSLRRQVLALQEQVWPSDVPPPPDAIEPVHDPALNPISMLLINGHTVVAALDVLTKTIEHAGQSFLASGLSTVVTDSARRGQGHGQTLVVAAREFIASTAADIGLFTCDPPLLPFYLRCGWERLSGCVLIGGTLDQPFPSDDLNKVTLGAWFSAHGRNYAAMFPHARVALYPGTIDRLW